MFRVLFNLAFFAGMILWAHRAPRTLLRTIVCLMMLLAIGMLVQIATGWLRWSAQEPGQFAEIHRWTGHGIVIVAWLLMLAGIASSIVFGLRYQGGLAWLSGLGTSLMFGICLWTSFTGYLLPNENQWPGKPEIMEETRNRFVVLHGCVCPLVTLLILGGCAWFCLLQLRRIRQVRGRAADEAPHSDGSVNIADGSTENSADPNPYKAPKE